MTYNLGKYINRHLSLAANIIKDHEPDVLVLNEASWAKCKPHILKKLSAKFMLPYFLVAKSIKTNNHTVIYSKNKMEDDTTMVNFRNAGIIVTVNTKIGDVSIAGVHLAPNTEDNRLLEIERIISKQKKSKLKIILGDLNSISPNNTVISSLKSHGLPEAVRYDVVNRIKKAGYVDAAVITQKEQISTVPITQDNNIIYYNLRLDYVFLSKSLTERAVNYSVIINEKTRVCSDHYPIMVQI